MSGKKPVGGYTLGTKIIQALGLGDNITTIELRCEIGRPAEMTLTTVITSDDGIAITEVIKCYQLVERA